MRTPSYVIHWPLPSERLGVSHPFSILKARTATAATTIARDLAPANAWVQIWLRGRLFASWANGKKEKPAAQHDALPNVSTFYLSINQCPTHREFFAITIDEEDLSENGHGTRLTPSKCCGQWTSIRRWAVTAEALRRSSAEILEYAARAESRESLKL